MPDRDTVVSRIETICVLCKTSKWKMVFDSGTIYPLLKDAIAILKERETKTGKWIEQDGYDGDVYYDCSVCGESWVLIDGTPQENGMHYCPHCGAKMEGR